MLKIFLIVLISHLFTKSRFNINVSTKFYLYIDHPKSREIMHQKIKEDPDFSDDDSEWSKGSIY